MAANDIVHIKVVNSVSEIIIDENDPKVFKPIYLHQVFNENESIYGYLGLKIYIYYLIGSMQAYIDFEYNEKLEDADDIYDFFDKLF